MNLTLEQPAHAGAIEMLLDRAFGPKRNAKTVYKLRRGVAPVADLCFVALEADGELAGTIRYWPITIGGGLKALLLGPIAVAETHRGDGLGGRLIRESLARATELGHRIVLLVGDAPYYTRFGFSRDKTLGLRLPGPVDLDRFLGLELSPGALLGVTGRVGRAPSLAPPGLPKPAGAADGADPEPEPARHARAARRSRRA